MCAASTPAATAAGYRAYCVYSPAPNASAETGRVFVAMVPRRAGWGVRVGKPGNYRDGTYPAASFPEAYMHGPASEANANTMFFEANGSTRAPALRGVARRPAVAKTRSHAWRKAAQDDQTLAPAAAVDLPFSRHYC